MAGNVGLNIVTNDLILYLDAANGKSYSGSGVNWIDLTKNLNNVTLMNGAYFIDENKGTIVFDGVDEYAVTNNVFGPTEFTICAWCKIDYNNSDTYGRIVEKGFNSEWSLTINKFPGFQGNDKFNFQYFDNANIVISNININPNKYQYVVCTIQDNGGGIKTGSIYVDGVFDNSGTRNATLFGQNAPITIGGQVNELSIASLKGNIPVVQFYGRILTPSEILQNYNAMKGRFEVPPKNIITDGLVMYLDASNNQSYSGSGVNWIDLTNNMNNGTLINGPTFDSNYGGSIVFDGINDFVQVNNSSSLNPSQTITLCAWAKYNGNYTGFGGPIIFKKNNSSSFFEQYNIAFSPTGNVGLAIGNGSNNQAITTPLSYTNQLVNVVGIIDTITATLKIYINGDLKISGSTIFSTMSTSTSPVVIGAYNEPFAGFMGGNIYNTAIYNRVLSDSEILQNYNTLKEKFN